MKITESQLKQIIREEVEAVIDEGIGKTLGKAGLGLALALGSGADAQADSFDDKFAKMQQDIDDDDPFAMDSSKSLPTDAESAKDSLSKIAVELEAAGDDKFKRLDIFNKYGLQNQNTDAKSGITTFVFDTQSGQPVRFAIDTNKVPSALVSR